MQDHIACQLFVVVKDRVFSAGGDGDGWIISRQYKDLANLFEKWDRKDFTYRRDLSDSITFSCGEHSQECIIFSDNPSILPPWETDIVVIL